LLVVVTLLSIWLGIWTYGARKQQRAVQALRSAGGEVRYDYALDANGKLKPIESQRPFGPEWLHPWLGADYWHEVVGLGIGDYRKKYVLGDDALKHVESFSNVDHVLIAYAAINGEGLSHLKILPRLRILCVFETPITDIGMVHLKDIASLEELALLDTQVTDAGLAHLHGMRNLKSLQISVQNVTSSGITPSGIDAIRNALPRCKVEFSHPQGRW
jgi:hypothetical protein